MEKWNNQLMGVILVTGLTFLTGCSLDDPAPSDTSPALQLLAVQNLSLVNLSWDPVKVTGFKEYILLQSATEIPNRPTPMVTAEISIIKRIDDMDVTSFSVSPSIFSPRVCYKLYCSIDERFLYSSSICIDQDIDKIAGFYDRACRVPDKDEIVMFDRFSDNFSIANFRTGAITQTVNDIILNFPSLEMSIWDNTTHVFGFDQSPPILRKYNYPSLTSTQFKSFNSILWAANVYHQFIFIASEEPGKNFQVLSRNTLNVLDSRGGLSGAQNLAVFGGDPVTVIAIGPAGARKYAIDQNGKITQDIQVNTALGQPDLQSTCAEGSEIFIAGRQGGIIDRESNLLGFLNSDPNSLVFLNRLSPDEKKAMAVINENGIHRLVIFDLQALPLISRIKSHDIPSLNYADLFVAGDIIYLIGASFVNGQSQTFILKYPM